ncbi:MAG: glycoside hydrolase family 172 protein [Kiritimatiellia bacterium]
MTREQKHPGKALRTSATSAGRLAGAVTGTALGEKVVNTASLFRNLYDLDRLALEADGVCRLASSYCRHETNCDINNFLSIDANGTAVLADLRGPGAIVRLQSANPVGQLRIYLDGQEQPIIDMPFKAFFEDARYAPLRTAGILGSFVSYWPIPYAKSCKVVVEKPGNFLYWMLNYKTYPENTKVESYTPDLTDEAKAEWEKASEAWRNPAGFVPEKCGLLGDGQATTQSTARVQIAAGENASVFTADGPGCVDSIMIRTKAGAADLKRVVLRAYWDGEKSPSVESPLPDFFGSGFAGLDVASLPVVMKRGDYYLCRFRMPFAHSADIRLDNGLAGPIDVVVEVEHRKMKRLAPDALYFHAHWHRDLTKSMTPFTMLETTGKGRLVGVSMAMEGNNERGSGYLEGDELIYMDGEQKPSWHGTGAEDFFNGSWYFSGQQASLALYGCTELKQNNTAAYRFFLPDDAPFQRSLAARLEHGGDLRGYDICDPEKPKSDKWSYTGAPYACTAYYYQKEPHTVGSFIASASALDYFVSPGPLAHHAIEAEECKPRVVGGRIELQKWEDFAKGVRGTIVPTLVPDDVNASLQFSIPVRCADRYVISAYMARGREYGACVCSLEGQPLSEIDLHDDGDARPADEIRLGEALLKPGENVLTFTSKGKMKIGVDRIGLQSTASWIRHWQVIGPFDNPGAHNAYRAIEPGENVKYIFGFSGIDQVYPPEQDGFVPGKFYEGKSRAVTWTPVLAGFDGHVDLAAHLEPIGASNVGYLYTRIDSPEEMDTEINVAPSDSLKIWINGQEIFRLEMIRNQTPAHSTWTPIHLRKGENALLLKVTHSFGNFFGCYARIRDPENKLSYHRT